jgi:hypothetical protein
MLRLCSAIILAVSLSGPASAQALVEKARQAEALAGKRDFLQAMAVLDEAVLALWEKMPLTFRKGLWVADAPTGFGVYSPRENNVFAAGAPMIVYVEPVGYGWRRSGDLWRMDINVDSALKTKSGQELWRQNDARHYDFASHVRNQEFMMHFNYTFRGIRPGDYVTETTLRDAVTGKRATLTLPFVVR